MGKIVFNENEAFEKLKVILYLWDSHNVLFSQRKIDKFFETLIYLGWNRRRVYFFTFNFIKQHLNEVDYQNIPVDAFDYLSDIESSIIGYCSYESILKFPNEPENETELIAYVRGKVWEND